MDLDTTKLDSFNKPLLAGFICLSFLDIFTTLLALKFPSFYELNRVAGQFFAMGGTGVLLAIFVKLLPLPALLYWVLSNNQRRPLFTRMGKVAATVALVYGDVFYFYVVALNNVPTLLTAIH
jgi:Domain of unknown function (DUF5658)